MDDIRGLCGSLAARAIHLGKFFRFRNQPDKQEMPVPEAAGQRLTAFLTL
jgi:hypothetical protein